MATSHSRSTVDLGEGTSTGVTAVQSRSQLFDRLDDTLVETVLSYLTFNDKVSLESVCKRFQRLIYNRQTVFHLTRLEPEGNDCLNRILKPIKVVDYTTAAAVSFDLKCINKKWLNSILKKCKSINKVLLDCYTDVEDLNIICRNCPNLNILYFETIGLDANDLDHIGRKYGHYFREISFFSSYYSSSKYWTKLLVHCKNLKKMSSTLVNDMIIDEDDYLPQMEVITDYYINDDFTDQPDGSVKILNEFNKFSEKYANTLKWISIHSWNWMSSTELDLFLTSLCKLSSLNHLDVTFQINNETDGTIDRHMTQLSNNCPDIEYFNLSVHSQSLKFENIFESFKGFKNLKEFHFYINQISSCQSISGSIKCLQSSYNLKCLTISFEKITEDFFDGIAQCLPNLSELIIQSETDISDKLIYQLSGLKKLTKFYLRRYGKCNKNITDDSICSIITDCPLIEVLSFTSRPNITTKTIEALITCANKYSKRTVEFICGLSDAEDENEFAAINLLTFVDRLPHNLSIEITEPTANDQENII